MFLAPILNDVCLNSFPPKVSFAAENYGINNDILKDKVKSHTLGKIITFTLSWENSYLEKSMYLKLMNTCTNVDLCFIPFPDKYNRKKFFVRPIEIDIYMYDDINELFKGVLILETKTPIQGEFSWETNKNSMLYPVAV